MTRRTLKLKHPPKQGQPIDDVVEQICCHCRFWFDQTNECRRRPPAIDWQNERDAAWPVTAALHWCGEFKRLPIDKS